MSTSKGKRYEREVARELRDLGWSAQRVAGSGGFPGSWDADLLLRLDDGTHDKGVAGAVQHGDIPRDSVIRAEVKYSSDGIAGAATLYDAHHDVYGLRTPYWLDWGGGVLSGGLLAYTTYLHGDGRYEPVEWRLDEQVPKGIIKLLEGERTKTAPDALITRRARAGWIAVWQSQEA